VLTTDVSGFLTAESAIALTSVSVNYYGGTTSTSYYCVSTTGVFTGSYTQGASCTDGSGSTAGQYVTISAGFDYKVVFPVDKSFMPTSFSQTVIVRLA
jgi:hypothetical protein